jgi:hypothetical protein
MSSSRAWFFRGLVILGTAMILVSWFLPWWAADIIRAQMDDAVIIYPYGLYNNMGDYFVQIQNFTGMPVWFTPFMWAYLGVVVVLLLFSLFLKEKKVNIGKLKSSRQQLIIGGAGLSYLVAAAAAVIVIWIRAGDFYGLRLQGFTLMSFEESMITGVQSGLHIGFWLACCTGVLLVVVALLRNKIIGKPKLSA